MRESRNATATSALGRWRWSGRLIRSIGRIGLVLLAVFTAAIVALWILQERLVFQPPAVPRHQGRGATRIDYVSAGGQPLFGYLVRGSTPGDSTPIDRVIVLFHGNGELASSWIEWAQQAAGRTDWPVFLSEYRGYGGLPGRPTYDRVMRDARATLDLLRARYALTDDDIVVYGHSLGTGVATRLAAERSVRAVVLDAPITSVVDVARRTFGPPLSWVASLISRVDFAPIQDVRRIEIPVWVASGGRDEVLPTSMGREVFGAALRKGKFLLVPTAGHDDVAERGGDRYWEWLGEALESHGSGSRTPAAEPDPERP